MSEQIMPVQHKRIDYIDAMKALGIIAIVFYHVSDNLSLQEWLSSFHLQVFFFAAGLTFRQRPIKEYTLDKFFKLLVPYYFFAVVTAIYGLAFERHFREVSYSFTSCICGIITGEGRYLKFNVVLWFLPALFITLCVFNVVVNLFSRRKIIIYVITAVFAGIHSFMQIPPMFFGIEHIFYYTAFVAAGYAFAQFFHNKEYAEHLDYKTVILLTFFTGVLSVTAVFFLNSRLSTLWISSFLGIAFVLSLGFLLKSFKWLCYVGKNTLSIFALHGIVYRGLLGAASLLLHLNISDMRESNICSIFVSVVTILICLALNAVLKKLIPWACGIRCPNKK